MDPVEIRMKNIVREGMFMPAYFGETANACALDRCIEHCAANFNWAEKYPVTAHHRNFAAVQLFDACQILLLLRCTEADRRTVGTGAGRAADAVHVSQH